MEKEIKDSFAKLDVNQQKALLEELRAIHQDEQALIQALDARKQKMEQGESTTLDELRDSMRKRKSAWQSSL